MKTVISYILAVILFTTGTTAATTTTKTGTYENKVTTVTIEQQTDELAYEDRTDVGEIEYDKSGRISKADSLCYSQWEKYIDPKIIYTVLTAGTDYYKYNDDDTIATVTRKDEDGKTLFTVEYGYDKSGKLSTETYKSSDKTVVSTYQYSDDGNIEYIYRDEGNKTVEYKYYYHGDGTFKGIRQRYTINDYTVLDWTSTINLNADGTYLSIVVDSGNMMDESTAFHFEYKENEIDNVTFVQGYFQVSYKISYGYSDIEVSK